MSHGSMDILHEIGCYFFFALYFLIKINLLLIILKT